MNILNRQIILLIAVSALVVSIGTLLLQTGSRPFDRSIEITDYNGQQCVFKEFGFPSKAITTIEEPCAYAVNAQTKPYGIEVAYTFINVPALFAGFVSWVLLLTVFNSLLQLKYHALQNHSIRS